MTNQTKVHESLRGSPAGAMVLRLCTLALAVILSAGDSIAVLAQEQPNPSPAKAAKPVETKPAAPAEGKLMGGYSVHSMVELGGRFTEKDGSQAMWATMVNQTTGARVLAQSLEMHTLNPAKTPFFDRLSTSSFGYGGDPYDVSMLKMSKGRWYDFMGQFRRDRSYFDYNLLANSLLSTSTAATPALVPEPDSLHIYNTVRRNTDTLLTLMPVSVVSFRAGFNHNTNEGPTLSTLHNGGDVQLAQWFRTGLDTYTGGVDVKLARRTTVSYDQFYAFYKGDTLFHLAPTPLTLPDGTPVSLGVDTLATTKCGTSGTSNYGPEVVNGIANPFCSGTTSMDQTGNIRNSFPTEQLRFSSHYWDRLAMNGRFTYSGGTGNINHFNETFIGFNTRTMYREQSDTGALSNGSLGSLKRVNVNADYGVVAELTRFLEISDAVNFWDFRIPTSTAWNEFTLTGVATKKGPPVAFGTSLLTPLNDSRLTASTTPNTDGGYLGQKNTGNTLIADVSVTPEVKVSAGWRFNDRQIKLNTDDTMDWHQNWLLLGGVVTPSSMVRISLNYDMMRSKSANSTTTPSNTYTREAPDKIDHFRGRVVVKPAKWINFAVAGTDYSAKNDDPQVNHQEHNQDVSIAAQLIPAESISIDLSYAHDDVFSVTDLCYTSTLATGTPGAGTCTNSAASGASFTNPYLGNGYYDAPTNFFTAGVNYSPLKYFRINAGARVNSVHGSAEFLNPLEVPGALQSKIVAPYADLIVNIAPQWSWHGNWNHQGYDESGPAGPAPRAFHGDIYTLGVKYAF